MFHAQVLEYALVNFVVASRHAAGAIPSQEEWDELYEELFTLTMGQQLSRSMKEAQLTDAQIEQLRAALHRRNFLAHDYFRERIPWMESERGRDACLEELDQIREELMAADADLEAVTVRQLARSGISEQEVKEIIRLEAERQRAKYRG
jgi:hypothetical protein